MNIINLTKGAEEVRANCYLITAGKTAALVDPGINKEFIKTALEKMGYTLKYILLTHGHFDHIFDTDRMRKETGAQVAIHPLDAEMLSDSEKSGFKPILDITRNFKPADFELADGDEITLTDEACGESVSIRVIHTPGHTRGSVCFLIGDNLITGDTLFLGDVGRTDLYGGDTDELYRSLEKLAALGQDYTIYPGHGGASSLRAELSRHIEMD